ncbi:MAG: hypothetical protein H0A75_05170 [Candidatus Methanofishera endochildressiae]|uniref:Pesticidal crystal protein Cry22Aa Ig-like domain-containing protein n=1 Tax=Candidatus Methanofishera endochildressiae TaxID=2738884 RepID=A0A7Z0SCZ6_9GAMM|nr:hypothetical protein [Candidatus Methanofishera endochildressiae]
MTYSVTDSAGHIATAIRIVLVESVAIPQNSIPSITGNPIVVTLWRLMEIIILHLLPVMQMQGPFVI